MGPKVLPFCADGRTPELDCFRAKILLIKIKRGLRLPVPSTSILSEPQKSGIDPKRPFRADKTSRRWDCFKFKVGRTSNSRPSNSGALVQPHRAKERLGKRLSFESRRLKSF